MSTFAHNKVDIYIREKAVNSSGTTREIRVPWLPTEIKYESGGMTVASYDILNKGEVQVPTATGLRKYSWSGELPGINRQGNPLQRGIWNDPSYYHQILEDWRKKGTPLTLLVTGYPINIDVYLTKYSGKAAGGFGDITYDVEFTEKRDITITVTRPAPATSGTSTTTKPATTTSTKRPAQKTTVYKIKKGDTLWKIAKKYLGSGKKWKTIYNANKKIIESTAKKRGYKSSNNGNRIFAGVKIQIPR